MDLAREFDSTAKGKKGILMNQVLQYWKKRVTRNVKLLVIKLALDELSAENVEDGANPSKTYTAAPASVSKTEFGCNNKNLVIRNYMDYGRNKLEKII